jgi:DNA-binding winged helix-turn-helix (wHTH) protein
VLATRTNGTTPARTIAVRPYAGAMRDHSVVRSTSLVITSPDGVRRSVELRDERVSIGRGSPTSHPDVELGPDPQRWVSRVHCVLEFRGGAWYASDNATVNGTLIRRGDRTAELEEATRLVHGDTILILGGVDPSGSARYWSLAYADPYVTRPADVPAIPEDRPRVEIDWVGARVFRRIDGQRHEVVDLRPKAYRLLLYMAGRSEHNRGAPAVCTYEELITALWGERRAWPAGRSFTKEDVRDVVNDARARLELEKARPRLLETVRGIGYRLAAWVDSARIHEVDESPMVGSHRTARDSGQGTGSAGLEPVQRLPSEDV